MGSGFGFPMENPIGKPYWADNRASLNTMAMQDHNMNRDRKISKKYFTVPMLYTTKIPDVAM